MFFPFNLPGGDEVETLTIGGLAKRSVELWWPAIAREAGFARPDRPPAFLTLETAQYYMERVVQPFIAERYYFEEVRLAHGRIYSQLLDNLNKAPLVGFPYGEVGKRLIGAWAGPSQQIITFTQVQDCLNRFRAYCLEHNLLDFSLQIELFHGLLQHAWFRDKLYTRYRHLIVDNVEEDVTEDDVKTNKVLEVNIPAGIDEGQRSRLSGKGEPGMNSGPPGDLYIEIRLRKHDIFERDGDDLYCEVPIPFTMAALGGELDIPTLDGQVKLKVPAETQTGRMFRLKGKGVQSVRSHRTGDLLCRAVIETPVKLTREQKDLLKKFERTFTPDNTEHNPRYQSWLDGVREFFDRMTS